MWLAGLLFQVSGWVLQGVALDKGPLMAVQAITTLSLVIALPFGAWLTHQHIDRTVVLGALAVVAGIVVFLSVGSPHGGTTHPSARTWWIACLVTLVLVLAMAGLGRTRHGAVRALLFGRRQVSPSPCRPPSPKTSSPRSEAEWWPCWPTGPSTCSLPRP